jgi:replicative DNA helicase
MIGFGKFSQENVLTILVFDKENSKFVSEVVNESLFDAPYYRTIAKKAIQFIYDYGKPLEEHIADELELELTGPDNATYREILNSLFTLKNNYNSEYIIDKLTDFIRDKKFTTNLVTAHNLYVQGNKEKAIDLLKEAFTFNLSLFDPGLSLDDVDEGLASNNTGNTFPTGISILDKYEICPTRKQLYTFIAPSGGGKSWNLLHLAKIALYAGYKVVYITLEMSEKDVYSRLIQSIFAFTRFRTDDVIKSAIFNRNGVGDLIGINQLIVGERTALKDEDIISIVKSKLPVLRGRTKNIRIKEFPTSGVSLSEIIGYIDGLERTQNFIPDIVLVDYADLIKLDASNLRIELGQLYKSLRGFAVERNLAVCTASQVNRYGSKQALAKATDISEDYSKVAISDILITYNQTDLEQTCHLARLYVDKSRNSRDNLTVLISQNYDIGQFCLDSVYMPKNYNIEHANIEIS